MKNLIKKKILVPVVSIFPSILLEKLVFCKNGTYVLMYHAFHKKKSSYIYSTAESDFKKQVILMAKKKEKFVITIDDGYKSVKTIANSILEKHLMPFCIFINSAYIGTRDSYLTWDDLQKMNCIVGGHTLHHLNLHALSERDCILEIEEDFKKIKKKGFFPRYFSYPGGNISSAAKKIVEKLFDAGFSDRPVKHETTHSVTRINIDTQSYKEFLATLVLFPTSKKINHSIFFRNGK